MFWCHLIHFALNLNKCFVNIMNFWKLSFWYSFWNFLKFNVHLRIKLDRLIYQPTSLWMCENVLKYFKLINTDNSEMTSTKSFNFLFCIGPLTILCLFATLSMHNTIDRQVPLCWVMLCWVLHIYCYADTECHGTIQD